MRLGDRVYMDMFDDGLYRFQSSFNSNILSDDPPAVAQAKQAVEVDRQLHFEKLKLFQRFWCMINLALGRTIVVPEQWVMSSASGIDVIGELCSGYIKYLEASSRVLWTVLPVSISYRYRATNRFSNNYINSFFFRCQESTRFRGWAGLEADGHSAKPKETTASLVSALNAHAETEMPLDQFEYLLSKHGNEQTMSTAATWPILGPESPRAKFAKQIARYDQAVSEFQEKHNIVFNQRTIGGVNIDQNYDSIVANGVLIFDKRNYSPDFRMPESFLDNKDLQVSLDCLSEALAHWSADQPVSAVVAASNAFNIDRSKHDEQETQSRRPVYESLVRASLHYGNAAALKVSAYDSSYGLFEENRQSAFISSAVNMIVKDSQVGNGFFSADPDTSTILNSSTVRTFAAYTPLSLSSLSTAPGPIASAIVWEDVWYQFFCNMSSTHFSKMKAIYARWQIAEERGFSIQDEILLVDDVFRLIGDLVNKTVDLRVCVDGTKFFFQVEYAIRSLSNDFMDRVRIQGAERVGEEEATRTLKDAPGAAQIFQEIAMTAQAGAGTVLGKLLSLGAADIRSCILRVFSSRSLSDDDTKTVMWSIKHP
jgi:hypothetical protein